jgi:glycosylphosphatidylinositol transamidase (GPIT) subunit GPI8
MKKFIRFRQLNTNKNSKIIVIITSHGGENFIKIRGTMGTYLSINNKDYDYKLINKIILFY